MTAMMHAMANDVSTLAFLALCLGVFPCLTYSMADVVAIAPDRSTAYPNGLHNGLLLESDRLNITLEVRDVGNFDPEKSQEVLRAAIASSEQPKIYCIWPVDFPSRELVAELHETHQVPIIQINQLPGVDSQWEWDHLIGYAGPDDALRASNAGFMMIQAFAERSDIIEPKVYALGYPATYGGYNLSIAAFSEVLDESNVTLVQSLPLDWGTQPAYLATLRLIETEYENGNLHGIYAMDDNILQGVYQALRDLNVPEGEVILVGTVCNGSRELLESGVQYGTTVQGPLLEGKLAVESAWEYLMTGNISERIRFTPNPIATGETWEDMFVDFLGQSNTVDELCTWNLFYERTAGLTSVEDSDSLCEIASCTFIPIPLFAAGYVLLSINYVLAAVGGALVWFYRNKKLIRIGQPFFLVLIAVGSMVDNTSILFMSRDNRRYSDEQLDASCVAWTWLLSTGHMLTTATLVAKIYRVKKLLGVGTRRRLAPRKVEVTVKGVSFFIAVLLTVDIVLLALWYIVSPFQWYVKITGTDFAGYITEVQGNCKSNGSGAWIFPLVLGITHFGVVVYANVLAYQTSPFHSISDSKSVAVALFNSIQLMLIATPMLVVIGDNVASSYLIRVCFVFLNNFGVLVLVLWTKLIPCLQGNGDITYLDLHRPRSGVYITGVNEGTPSQVQMPRASGSSDPASMGGIVQDDLDSSKTKNSSAVERNPNTASAHGGPSPKLQGANEKSNGQDTVTRNDEVDKEPHIAE